MKLIFIYTSLLFALTTKAENVSMVSEVMMKHGLEREGSESLRGAPSKLFIKTGQGRLETFNLHFIEEGLYIECDSDLNGKPIRHFLGDYEGVNYLELSYDTLPMYHDYNSDGYKDYALHLRMFGPPDEPVFFIYNPELKKFEWKPISQGARGFTFDLKQNLVIFHDVANYQEFGYCSSYYYYFLIGHEWKNIGSLDFGNYAGSMNVQRGSKDIRVKLTRDLWLNSHGLPAERRKGKTLETADAWANDNILKLWQPDDKQINQISKTILKKKYLPEFLKYVSKETITAIDSALPVRRRKGKLATQLTELRDLCPSITVPNHKFYRVKKGDTLYSISKKHKVSIEQLKMLNGLVHESVIFAGEDLVLR